MEERRDLYEVLGVSKTATADELRKAYRQAALKHHPDRNNGDPAAARFKEATEAFQVLQDDEKRAIYDQYGFAGLEGAGGGFPGVDQAYAVQAGREIRVVVNPTEINDREAAKMCRDIATAIEQSLTYPGEVKVTVLRETRVVEYAR